MDDNKTVIGVDSQQTGLVDFHHYQDYDSLKNNITPFSTQQDMDCDAGGATEGNSKKRKANFQPKPNHDDFVDTLLKKRRY